MSGVVTDPTGARVPQAAVQAAQVKGPVVRQALSDSSGHYSLSLPAGLYDVVVTVPGFDAYLKQVRLAPGASVDVSAKLVISAENASVEVDANVNGVSTSEVDNKSSLELKGAELATLSDDDATFQQQLLAIAGGDGQHPPQIYVDGFSGGTIPPKKDIRAIKINQNPFSAEYDSLGFGRMEILTKPGTGKLHGSAELMGNPSAFNSQNPFLNGVPEPSYYRFHARGGLSGPILDKKTSFVLNGEYYNQQNNAVVVAALPSGAFSQAVPDPQTTQDYSARLDRQWSTNNTFTGRYDYNRVGLTNGGLNTYILPSEAYNSLTTIQTLQLGNTQVVNAHLELDSRFQWIRTRVAQDAISSAPTILVSGSFSGGGAPTQNYHDNQDHLEFEEKGSYDKGKSYVRMGFRYRLYRDANLSTANFNGTYTFPTLASCGSSSNCAGGTPSQVSVATGQSHFTTSTGDLSAYVEEEYRATKSVTIDAGFRFESQSAIPDHFDPSPHVGVAWAVGQTSKKPAFVVLRAGSGIFYDRFPIGNLLTTVQQSANSGQQIFTSSTPGPCTITAAPDAACLGGATAAQPTTYRLDPNYRSGYELTSGASAEFTLGKHGSISANYLHIHGVHQGVSINANAPRTDGTRPMGAAAGDIYEFASGGEENGNFFFTNPQLHFGKLEFWAFGIVQHNDADTAGNTQFASNSYDIRQDYGRSGYDRRHAIFTGVNGDIRKGLNVGAFLAVRGGNPFNITTGADNNGDTIYNDRPAFASATTLPQNLVKTAFGNFDVAPTPGEKLIPINYGPPRAFLSLQVQAEKTWQFGPRIADPDAAPPEPGKKAELPDPRYSLSLSVEGQNVTNSVSPGIRVGVLSSPNFGKSISTANSFLNTSAANRTFTLHTTFRF